MHRRDVLRLAALVPPSLLLPPSSPVSAQEAGAVEHLTDIEYGSYDTPDGPLPLLLDVYHPTGGEGPRPAVVLIHGGGLVLGDRTFMAPHAEGLAAAGYVAINIEYRVSAEWTPYVVWPDHLDDAQRAVRWVRAHAEEYGIDPERVCACGHSAGGTLTALLAVRDTREEVAAAEEAATGADAELSGISSRVDLAVALAPVTEFRTDWTPEFYVAVFGGTLAEVPDAYADATALAFVDAESAPMLLVHGVEDMDVPIEQSRLLAEALDEAGVEAELVEVPDAYHDHTNDWTIVGPIILPFLESHLRP